MMSGPLLLLRPSSLGSQILSAFFTQFYLKDVAWADTELFHLGPVVAAQQVHHQAPKLGDM